MIIEGPLGKDVYMDWARKIGMPFEEIGVEVIDVDGAGNVSKYLGSPVIQRTCFSNYAICDRNAEAEIRKKVEGIVPEKNLKVLQKGDIEDYYPRKLVIEFAQQWAEIKDKKKEGIPDAIGVRQIVQELSKLLGGDWWKRKLAQKVMEETGPADIDEEVKNILTVIYNAVS